MTKTNGAGYTIVELMIVLAITGVTAVSAFAMIHGQQSRHEFSQAVRDFEVKLTDVANDVAKGFFPNMGPRQSCSASENAGLQFSSMETEEQGSSEDCVFAGKVIEFNPGADDTAMRVMTVTARRETRDQKNVTSLESLTGGDLAAVPGLDTDLRLLHGLRVKTVKLNGMEGHESIGFFSGFGSKTAGVGQLTGAPETDLFWISNSSGACSTNVDMAVSQPACYISPDNSAKGIEICLEHGAGGRTALITLGRDGRQMTTTTEIDFEC